MGSEVEGDQQVVLKHQGCARDGWFFVFLSPGIEDGNDWCSHTLFIEVDSLLAFLPKRLSPQVQLIMLQLAQFVDPKIASSRRSAVIPIVTVGGEAPRAAGDADTARSLRCILGPCNSRVVGVLSILRS